MTKPVTQGERLTRIEVLLEQAVSQRHEDRDAMRKTSGAVVHVETEFNFCRLPGCDSVCEVLMESQAEPPAALIDVSEPLANRGIPKHARDPAFVIDAAACVHVVFGGTNNSEVRNSIVEPLMIDVVNLMGGPIPVMQGPSDTVRLIGLLKDQAVSVATGTDGSQGGLSGVLGVPRVARAQARKQDGRTGLPSKRARRGLVFKKLTQRLRRETVTVSHSAVLSRGGQSRAVLEHRCGSFDSNSIRLAACQGRAA
jgi:hypothetical protein